MKTMRDFVLALTTAVLLVACAIRRYSSRRSRKDDAMTPFFRVALILIVLPTAALQQSAGAASPSQLLGTWHGTSLCSDRVAAPACRDETVVYVFTPGARSGIVHWAGYKIVDAKRELMGEFDLSYDSGESCWKAEFTSPRVKSVWRLTVNAADGKTLTGTARLLPGNETIRRISAQKE